MNVELEVWNVCIWVVGLCVILISSCDFLYFPNFFNKHICLQWGYIYMCKYICKYICIYDLRQKRERREGRGRLWSLARKKGKGSRFFFWNSPGKITGVLSLTLDHVDSIMSKKYWPILPFQTLQIPQTKCLCIIYAVKIIFR